MAHDQKGFHALIEKIEAMDNAHLNLLVQRMEQYQLDDPKNAHDAVLIIGMAKMQLCYRQCEVEVLV
jgi:ferritin-like protein